ncbi:MAG: MarR family winged helix-turn-helix transcriptional regulator, partial [Caulobacterales bacterium]
ATGLSEMEMTVLNGVVGADTPPTVPRIGRSLGHPRQVIQRAANALIAKGLIAALPNPDHKRAVLLGATPSGRALKRKADSHAARLAARVIEAASSSRMRLAAEVIRDLRFAIEAIARERAPRPNRPSHGTEQ